VDFVRPYLLVFLAEFPQHWLCDIISQEQSQAGYPWKSGQYSAKVINILFFSKNIPKFGHESQILRRNYRIGGGLVGCGWGMHSISKSFIDFFINSRKDYPLINYVIHDLICI